MKLAKVILILAATTFSISAIADVYSQGYQRNDGTYVQPYHRSEPNGDRSDNWSTKGNVNPYTGQEGTKNPNEPEYSR